jgi:oxygen-independent coproporphyrinogen-3 oxidase
MDLVVSDALASGSVREGVETPPRELVDLLHQYNVTGPRYTSYPTAAEFTQAFGQAEYLALRGALPESISPLSLYVHVPFCESPCFYCGCNKIVTRQRSQVRTYLDSLQKEMALMRLQLDVYKRPVTQLHWGGGTPTYLDDGELTELMHHIANYFTLVQSEDRDYSIELDPRTVSETRIDLLRGLGFNRVSIGVQDFDPDVQENINRIQSFRDISRLVEYIRARSFRSLNFDLIYGLPGQTVKTMSDTLKKVVELSPDRISFYNYAHMPDRFPGQRAIDESKLPSPDQRLELLAMIIHSLAESGYVHIGMDHFVKPGDPLARALDDGTLCRNFQGYSVNKASEIIGLGVSSISSVPGAYVQNYRDMEHYSQCLADNALPVERGVALTREDELRRDVIQRITCYRRVEKRDVEKTYQIDFDQHFQGSEQALSVLEQDGLLDMADPHVISVTDKGVLFLRNICMVFDQYPPQKTKSGTRVFSSTV